MKLKVITYNIDGLPETLDLNDLPWVFKPLVWIYKKIKGTTVIRINDDTDSSRKMWEIGRYLASQQVDVIGVQEDFNYHTELVEAMPEHTSSTYTGGFDLSEVFSSMTWFPIPRFKADGINFFKSSNVTVNEEDIVSWNKSYGYFTHANDKLVHKGFRFYSTSISGITVDIYVLHMDADFYNPDSCPDVSRDVKARKSQLQQLTKYIIGKNSSNPSIIMGDTNSTEKYEWDVENINKYLIEPINSQSGLSINESQPKNMTDVDRVFYVNSTASPYSLEVEDCYYDSVSYSDHKPLVTVFELRYKAV